LFRDFQWLFSVPLGWGNNKSAPLYIPPKVSDLITSTFRDGHGLSFLRQSAGKGKVTFVTALN